MLWLVLCGRRASVPLIWLRLGLELPPRTLNPETTCFSIPQAKHSISIPSHSIPVANSSFYYSYLNPVHKSFAGLTGLGTF